MSYPGLSKLGIQRPHEISGYTVSSYQNIDTLRVTYARQKGSLLPVTKRFQFPRRPINSVKTDIGESVITEVSPALNDALTDLSKLLDNKLESKDRKAALLKDLEEFENFVSVRLSEIRSEIDKL